MEKNINKKLRSMNNNELYSVIIELVKLRKENKEWLTAKLFANEDIQEIINIYKKKMDELFFHEIKQVGWQYRIDISKIKQVIADFRKISIKPEHYIEILVNYIEDAIELEKDIGDLYSGFYDSVESVFKQVISLLNENKELIPIYKDKLEKAVSYCHEGWGHKDNMEDIFSLLKD